VGHFVLLRYSEILEARECALLIYVKKKRHEPYAVSGEAGKYE
jgi:hypothetical protein